MKILGVHNYYGSSAPSGENTVFETEMELLQNRGHEVIKFLRHSDGIRAKGALGAIRGAISTPWNPWSAAAIRREVERFRPDVVHVHNTFPLLSPAIFRGIAQRAACVLSLHNYRLFCPAAIPMRGGLACTECLDRKSSWPSLKFGCYRGSSLATAPLAFSVSLHRRIGTWSRYVDAFIVLTEFQKKLMTDTDLPVDRVYVKPNFYAGNPQSYLWADRGNYVVFAGRLSIEKGVEDLIRAWVRWGTEAPELRILGDGPLREALQKLALTLPAKHIRFLGQLPSADAERQIAEAKLLVLPSVCFEGFPMVIREAFAYGTPIAVSNIGPLPSIVKDGVNGMVFQPRDPESLLMTVRSAWKKFGLLERLGEGARREFEVHYNADANYDILMDIYARTLARRAA